MLYNNTYEELRAVSEEKMGEARKKSSFTGLVRETCIEGLVHLGRYAFSEIGNAVVAPVLFILKKTSPTPQHRIWACRLSAPRPSEKQATLLLKAVQPHSARTQLTFNDGRSQNIVSQPLQLRFLLIPQSTLCYWLQERFFELLVGRKVSDVANVNPGLCTGDDTRFVRFTWESLPIIDGLPKYEPSRRWVPFEKGGGYGKWYGHHFWAVDWHHNGARLKAAALPGTRVQNEHIYFTEGWTYSYMAQGSYGLRKLEPSTLFAHISSAG